jgi:hypothetical protein
MTAICFMIPGDAGSNWQRATNGFSILIPSISGFDDPGTEHSG